MRSVTLKKEKIRNTRAMRVRKKLRGTEEKPRMCVVKSNKHIQVQLIDDATGRTIGSIATTAVQFRNTDYSKKNKSSAAKLGEMIAEIAKGLNISKVVFDRGPFKYHGILEALATSAREAGLQF
jgi:large subunit ribosomal protein L18